MNSVELICKVTGERDCVLRNDIHKDTKLVSLYVL